MEDQISKRKRMKRNGFPGDDEKLIEEIKKLKKTGKMVTRKQLEHIKRIWDKYRVKQDVIIGPKLTLEDWDNSGKLWGRHFKKSDDVQNFVAYGDKYPLSGIDSHVEEILALNKPSIP